MVLLNMQLNLEIVVTFEPAERANDGFSHTDGDDGLCGVMSCQGA